MASPNLGSLDLANPESALAWLKAFSALSRVKKWKDEETNFEITDNFIAICGIDALQKLEFLAAPKSIDSIAFDDLSSLISSYLQPKTRILAAERTRFHQCRQLPQEQITDFVTRLRKMAKFCQFEKLKSCSDPNEEMILMALVAGISDSSIQSSVLEKMATADLSVAAVTEHVRNIEQMRNFVSDCSSNGTASKNDMLINKVDSSQRKSTLFYNNCKFCGSSHEARKCPAFGKKCSHCGKANHFAKMCKAKRQTAHHVANDNEEDIGYVSHSIHSISEEMQQCQINGKDFMMQIDTGASLTIISSRMWEDLGSPHLESYERKLLTYDGHSLPVKGKFQAQIEWRQGRSISDLVVVDSRNNFGLLGRDKLCNHIFNVKISEILPAIRGYKARIELKENTKSKFCPARDVPLSLEESVANELCRLEQLGVITPVTAGASSASPVVWVKKQDGSLRMCADYSTHLNDNIKTDAYPTPSIERILAKLKDSSKFAKLDLRSAYWQIELDDESKEMSVINTTKGLYYVNRLQMGMKNSSAIFQRTMESILAGLKGVLIYQDDICIFANNSESLEKRLRAVYQRLQEKRVSLNQEKCVEYCDEIQFLGFKISAHGIEPDDNLIKKVAEIPQPKTKSELEHFMGLVNYFGRLIPNFASISLPLNALRRKDNVFKWNSNCEEAFHKLKSILTSSPLLKKFNMEKEVTLTTDASKGAIGAVMTQDKYPVLYVSRTFSSAESKYSNIEREALALVWSILRLKMFLLGRRFTIVTDHQPLIYIFGKNEIPSCSSTRICRWATLLLPFDFEIKYVPGKDISHADAMSRINQTQDYGQGVEINAVYFECPIIPAHDIKFELKTDKFCNGLIGRIINGTWSNCSEKEKMFHQKAESLTINDDLIYYKSRIFIPARLRQQVFKICHMENHSGIQSTLRKIKSSCWWPKMSVDIEQWVKSCSVCNEIRPQNDKSVHHWPDCNVFERVHIDFAYVENVGNIFVLVDAHSTWIEAFATTDRSTETVKKCLRSVFTRFGIPKLLVSDNAPEFVSEELVRWLNSQGIQKMESPPYFPRSNGNAERAVRTVKDGLKAWKLSKTHIPFTEYLKRLLFHHRVSTTTKGKSPAEWMLGRTPRIPVVSIFPQGKQIIYRPRSNESHSATFLMAKGHNTSYVIRDGQLILASNNQIAPLSEREDDSNSIELKQCETTGTVENQKNTELLQSELPAMLPNQPEVRRSGRVSKPVQRYGFSNPV